MGRSSSHFGESFTEEEELKSLARLMIVGGSRLTGAGAGAARAGVRAARRTMEVLTIIW